MGQAKRRGSFEERRQQSIERTEAERLERLRKAQEWRDSLTPEQQHEEIEKRRRRRQTSAGMLSLTALLMGASFGGRSRW